MVLCKTAVSSLLTHWIYYSLAPNHRGMGASYELCVLYLVPLSFQFCIQCHAGLEISKKFSFARLQNSVFFSTNYIDGIVQDCSISIANSLEILQSCTKPTIYDLEENFAQIHFPGWQFYLPWVVGQWDMLSPVIIGCNFMNISNRHTSLYT